MHRLSIQIAFGLLAIIAGVLLLLQAVDAVVTPPLVWAVLLAGAAAFFAAVFIVDGSAWWAAIPGAAFLGAGTSALLGSAPAGGTPWAGVAFLGILSLGFWAVYLRDRARWWALIPAGVLVTLAVVSALAPTVRAETTGGVFLLGAAVTFVLVAVLRDGPAQRRWAWIPAAMLAVAAAITFFAGAEWTVLAGIVWPLAVIVAGGYLILRALRRRPGMRRGDDPTLGVRPHPSRRRNSRTSDSA